MKICIIGSGAYGIALASRFIRNGNEVNCYSNNTDEVNDLNRTRVSDKLNYHAVPSELVISSDLELCVSNSSLIVIAVPAKVVGSACESLNKLVTSEQHILIATKGIENESCLLLSDIVKDKLNTNKIVVISGPTFAIDIINDSHVSFSVGSEFKESAELVINALKNDITKLEYSSDVNGIEVCGAIKNVFAVISGILGGIGVSDSTKAFFLTEALRNIKEFISLFGGEEETILSYAGVGDCIMTSTSVNSRNYSYGKLIGEGKYAEAREYLKNTTVEGVYTLNSVKKILSDKGKVMPIIDVLDDIINEKKDRLCILDFLINN